MPRKPAVDISFAPEIELPITYPLPAAARVSGLSVRTLYNLHNDGRLPFIKVGSRTLVRRTDLVALIERAAAEGGAA